MTTHSHIATRFSRHVLSALVMAGSLMAAPRFAAAAVTTQHASLCKVNGNSSSSGLYTYSWAVMNYSGSALLVTCPVVRTAPAGASGFSVWVDGTLNAANGSLWCSLESIDYDGSFLGTVNFTVSSGGAFDKLLTLPQSLVPVYSSQSVTCSLPQASGLYDIEPVLP